MKRSLYYLFDEQHDWLREQAHQHHVTASALARLAVTWLMAEVDNDAVDLKAALSAQQEARP